MEGERSVIDEKLAEKLDEYINNKIQNYISKLPFNRMIRATVDSVGSGVADITLLDSSTIIPNVKIRDGLSLSPTDEVFVTVINNNINNMFIDIKI